MVSYIQAVLVDLVRGDGYQSNTGQTLIYTHRQEVHNPADFRVRTRRSNADAHL